jgi:hypothetical protein
MRSLGLSQYALSSCVATAMLVGCGGSQPPIGAPGAMPQSRAVATHAQRGGSWMLPEVPDSDLIYVSGGAAGVGWVYVFSYPQGQYVGSSSLSNAALYECVGGKGDVFITALSSPSGRAGYIYEYPHGATNPIATLSDPGIPADCSVDPTTGNLAVANYEDYSNPYYKNAGDVAVYRNAQGTPQMYYSSQFGGFTSCGYDERGNLFLAAFLVSSKLQSQLDLARLSRGSDSIEKMSLDAQIYYNSGVNLPSIQWDGRHMTVSSARCCPHNREGHADLIYRLKISGTAATVIGTTVLTGGVRRQHTAIGQSWIFGNRVIASRKGGRHYHISYWPYPKGGKYVYNVLKGPPPNHGVPFGLSISPTQSQ